MVTGVSGRLVMVWPGLADAPLTCEWGEDP